MKKMTINNFIYVCVCVCVSDKVAITADSLLSDLNETAVLVSNPTQSQYFTN